MNCAKAKPGPLIVAPAGLAKSYGVSRYSGCELGCPPCMPKVGFGLLVSAAEDFGGAELCSAAPPELSAWPDDGVG